MSLGRTILCVLLGLWLPLSCCCRLNAMFGISRSTGAMAARGEQASHGCCKHGASKHESAKRTSDKSQPHDGNDCGCGDRSVATLRACSDGAPAALEHVTESVVLAITSALWTRIEQVVDVRFNAGADERIKSGGTLLRRHCALTV